MPDYYGTLEAASSYHANRENTAWAQASSSPDDKRSGALLRASAWIDGRYRSRFPGKKTGGRSQVREWPRTGAVDTSSEAIASDEVPIEILDATFEAALRELVEPGSLSPDFNPTEAVKRIRKKVGDLEKETEYRDVTTSSTGVASAMPVFTLIDDLLSGLLGDSASSSSGTRSSFFLRA